MPRTCTSAARPRSSARRFSSAEPSRPTTMSGGTLMLLFTALPAEAAVVSRGVTWAFVACFLLRCAGLIGRPSLPPGTDRPNGLPRLTCEPPRHAASVAVRSERGSDEHFLNLGGPSHDSDVAQVVASARPLLLHHGEPGRPWPAVRHQPPHLGPQCRPGLLPVVMLLESGWRPRPVQPGHLGDGGRILRGGGAVLAAAAVAEQDQSLICASFWPPASPRAH